MKRLINAVLAVCLMVSVAGCGGKDKDNSQQAGAMGRYIETPVAENLDGASLVMDLHKTEDGAVFYTGWYADDANKLLRQNVQADGTLASESVPWVQSLADMGLSIIDLAESEDGTIYVIGRGSEGAQVFRTSLDNTALEAISITDWPQTTGSSGNGIVVGGSVEGENGKLKNAVPSGISSAPDGFVLIYDDRIEYRGGDGSRLKSVEGFANLAHYHVSCDGNHISVKNAQNGTIQLYDLSSGEIISEQSCEEFGQNAFAWLDGETLYMADSTGIFRQASNGTIWEKLVDGELTSLSTPSKSLAAVTEDASNGFYAVLRSPSGMSLMHYTYSADTPTLPDTELTIFTLEDHNIIRQAISEFQRQNPNVKVNLQIGLGNGADAATVQDVIRSLNTEILNGNGPDLLILDGLPAQSYIDKGVLADLTEFAGQMDGLMKNLLAGYQQDGKLFAIPAQFTLPIYLSKDGGGSISDFSALVAQAEAGAGNTPPYLLAPDNLSDPNGAFLMDWYDRLGLELIRDNTLDTDMLTGFFRDAKTLADLLRPYAGDSSGVTTGISGISGGSGGFEVIDAGPDALAGGKASAYAMTLVGQSNLRNLNTLARDGSWDLTSLFGKNQFIPLVNAGILESSSQKELAQSFLSTLCGEAVQSVYLGTGFPVNQAALEAVVKDCLSNESGELTPMGKAFYDLCQTVNSAIFVDETVRNAVEAQAKAVLDGTATPEAAAQAANEAVKLYLTE